ncbi:type II restriction endonuclease [Rhodohalobacter sulfatireducens]|uniref:Type II restriction endonuclease n=1 Tax=Rhodohalobacter sulfatireducens TaxID=2911366 RepID=A0ABS9KIT6_9BACT|nr:type II restriction endonuclease [Rhodohalobacter sulfatireducens]MCG2590764.1 type II restriction endonuclease [Rhodohalobacter sulfatireducens]
MKPKLISWIDDVKTPGYICYIKRLSGNDTLANGSHQAGPYVPKKVLLGVFPSLKNKNEKNPDIWFDLFIDSHNDQNEVRAIWYNNKFHGGTRNEARLTNFGGSNSALLDPDNTGALVVFAFLLDNKCQTEVCRVWICSDELEERIVEDWVGPIDPGQWQIWYDEEFDCAKTLVTDYEKDLTKKSCWLDKDEIPKGWLENYPSGLEIIKKTVELRPSYKLLPDERIIKRRECEFEVFKSLEEAVEFPRIKKGFKNIDEFLSRAQSILQRRKSRSGYSLELHTKEIFLEENLKESVHFSHQPESEKGKKPDFLFPSEEAYKNSGFPTSNLKMLAVKTTCKDRWRQILNEAERIEKKHLLTIQEGVSENQFNEMKKSSVQLVVPEPLFKKYPEKIRPQLQTLESFIKEVKT